MSYNFYSLVSSIKDKAMATLSSDLKEFTSIVQEDVAEVAKTVRKTVHEQSEALRQRVEEQRTTDDDDEGQDAEGDHHLDDKGDGRKAHRADEAPVTPEDDEEDDADAGTTMDRRGSLPSMFSFAGLSLEAVGSKILQSADGLLDTLARAGAVDGEIDDEDDDAEEDKLASARRYRLLALQEDEHTYLHPPMDVATFKKWRTALADEELASIQEEVLAHYPTVAHKLAELVPGAVSAGDFWAHYIYKASLLAAQEQRGADLLEHALHDSEEEIGWDADSPRNAGDDNGDNDGRFPTYEEEPHADDALPILEEVDAPEPSSPAPVLEEQRPLPPDTDDEAPIDSISSDGESWIELDEQREARRDAAQPPLSSSSSSSFVPVYGPRDGVYNVVATGGDSKAAAAAVGASSAAPAAAAPARVREDDEEDVDWGDEEDEDAPAPKPPGDAGAGSSDAPETKARAADWGEWD